jgi:hypothetical protein
MAQRWMVGVVVFASLGSSARAATPANGPALERRLHLASAESSSYLINDWNRFQENYLPLYVGDDDPKTAWTLKTEGIGEWLRVHVTPMADATKVRLRVRNGYQKTDKLWAANSRAHGLTVVLLPSKKTVDVELADRQGWQEIAVEQPAGPVDAVELRVRSVYEGKKYDDLCLSDVQVFVTATTPDNPAFEKARFQKIVDWKKGRLDAAKLFQTQLGQQMPIAAQYVASGEDTTNEDSATGPPCHDGLCYLRGQIAIATAHAKGHVPADLKTAQELAASNFHEMTAVRISTRDKRPIPQIDGVCVATLDSCVEDPCGDSLPLPTQLGYLDARSLVTTEQNGLPAVDDVIARKPPQCNRREPTTFAYVSRGPASADGTPGAIRAVLLATCGLIEGREGMFPASRPQLLVYGADGSLGVVAGTTSAATIDWDHHDGVVKLAAARVTSGPTGPTQLFTAATAIAGK